MAAPEATRWIGMWRESRGHHPPQLQVVHTRTAADLRRELLSVGAEALLGEFRILRQAPTQTTVYHSGRTDLLVWNTTYDAPPPSLARSLWQFELAHDRAVGQLDFELRRALAAAVAARIYRRSCAENARQYCLRLVRDDIPPRE